MLTDKMKDRSERVKNHQEKMKDYQEKVKDYQEKVKDYQEKVKEYQEEVQKQYKSSDTEDYIDRIFNNPIGFMFAKMFIRLKWTPNMVSVLAIVIGGIGALLLYPRTFLVNLIGVLLITLAIILDATDGQIARTTHQSSTFGRVLDGISTMVWCYIAYIVVAIRLSSYEVPFLPGVTFGWTVAPLFVVSGFFGNEIGNLLADYFRNNHLNFMHLSNVDGIDTSEQLKKDLPKYEKENFFVRWFMGAYVTYTRIQEKLTPKYQAMLNRIRKQGGEITDELREEYLKKSRKYLLLVNAVSINLRAMLIFVTVLCDVPVLWPVIEIVVFGGLTLFMRNRYEHIAMHIAEEEK